MTTWNRDGVAKCQIVIKMFPADSQFLRASSPNERAWHGNALYLTGEVSTATAAQSKALWGRPVPGWIGRCSGSRRRALCWDSIPGCLAFPHHTALPYILPEPSFPSVVSPKFTSPECVRPANFWGAPPVCQKARGCWLRGLGCAGCCSCGDRSGLELGRGTSLLTQNHPLKAHFHWPMLCSSC